MGLVSAEIRKLVTVRTTWAITGLGLALIAFPAAFVVFEQEFTGAFTGSDGDVAAVVDQVGGNSVIVLVVGVLAMATEFRHGTIGRTLQLTPSRMRVLAGKLVGGVVYSVGFVVAGLVVVALVLALAVAGGTGLDVGEETARAIWQAFPALGLTAALGVAVGALVRSQVLAVTLSLVWVFVIENLVNALLPAVGRWLPFQLLNALFLSEAFTGDAPAGVVRPIDPAIALTAFLSYVIAALVLAGVLLRVRDV